MGMICFDGGSVPLFFQLVIVLELIPIASHRSDCFSLFSSSNNKRLFIMLNINPTFLCKILKKSHSGAKPIDKLTNRSYSIIDGYTQGYS